MYTAHMEQSVRQHAERLQDAMRAEIRAEKAAQGVSRWKDLARNVGVSERTIFRYAIDGNDPRNIPLDVLIALCDALDVAPHEMMLRAEARVARDDAKNSPTVP